MDAILSHAAGAAIMYLDSVWMAKVLGEALAERSPCAKSAAVAAHNQNPVLAQQADQNLSIELFLIVLSAVVFSPAVLFPLCAMDMDDWTLIFVVVVSTMLSISLPVAIICARKPLQGGTVVILGEECGTGYVLVCWYISLLMLFNMSLILVSEVQAVVVFWICVLAMAVFLGYSLRLNDFYVRTTSWSEMEMADADGGNKEL